MRRPSASLAGRCAIRAGGWASSPSTRHRRPRQPSHDRPCPQTALARSRIQRRKELSDEWNAADRCGRSDRKGRPPCRGRARNRRARGHRDLTLTRRRSHHRRGAGTRPRGSHDDRRRGHRALPRSGGGNSVLYGRHPQPARVRRAGWGAADRAGLVAPDGSARQVAEDLAFPNGMLVTADGSTLIVAESYANRLTAFDVAQDGSLSNRRVWADLDDGVPDGICLDADGAVWYADVPNRRCVRVLEGGEVLQTIELDRGCFACALGGPDRATLFMTAQVWDGPQNMFDGSPTGQVLLAPAPAPGVGRP